MIDIDEVPFHKLSLKQDEPNDTEPLEVTQSLDLLPTDPMDIGAKDTIEEGQRDMEIILQMEA